MTFEEGEALKKQLAQALCENELLREQIRLLLKKKFNPSTETQNSSRQLELMMQLAELQQSLGDDEDPEDDPPPSRPRKKRTPRKPRLPKDLPVQIETHLPDEVKKQPENFKQIGEEVTEELDLVPVKYFIRRIVRPKFVDLRDRQRPPLIAPLAKRAIEGGYASAGLLSDIAVKKYRDHLPLYRQERVLKYQGIELSRKTMCDWMEQVSEWLKPIYNHIGNQLRAGPYLQVDETPVRYCGSRKACPPGRGGSKQGYLWVYNDPLGDVLYRWHPSRAADCLDDMLKSFNGTVQCDGYRAYTRYAREHDDIELAACWAHVRRKFHDARDGHRKVADWYLRQIGRLYLIERDLRDIQAKASVRQARRNTSSREVVELIHKALRMQLGRYLPQSLMGKAISYALGQWEGLVRFLDNGRVEIDN
jgi:transposase